MSQKFQSARWCFSWCSSLVETTAADHNTAVTRKPLFYDTPTRSLRGRFVVVSMHGGCCARHPRPGWYCVPRHTPVRSACWRCLCLALFAPRFLSAVAAAQNDSLKRAVLHNSGSEKHGSIFTDFPRRIALLKNRYRPLTPCQRQSTSGGSAGPRGPPSKDRRSPQRMNWSRCPGTSARALTSSRTSWEVGCVVLLLRGG